MPGSSLRNVFSTAAVFMLSLGMSACAQSSALTKSTPVTDQDAADETLGALGQTRGVNLETKVKILKAEASTEEILKDLQQSEQDEELERVRRNITSDEILERQAAQ